MMKMVLKGWLIGTTLALASGQAIADDDDDSDRSEWSTPEPVENVAGGCPIENRSGRTLYTAGGFDGTLDIWTYTRNGKRAPFGPREKIGPPVSLDDTNDFCPTPLVGGWLLFVSDRSGDDTCGNADMYITRYRPGSGANRNEARNLGCAPHGPNTDGRELSPALFSTSEGVFLYYSTNGPGGDQDIYRSRMGWNGQFGPGEPVDELNTAFNDQQPNVGRGGREIVFSSDRAGAGQDVFSATREDTDDAWSMPRNLSVELAFPTGNGSETRASLSWDLKRLYYGSAGTIYVAKRKPGRNNDD